MISPVILHARTALSSCGMEEFPGEISESSTCTSVISHCSRKGTSVSLLMICKDQSFLLFPLLRINRDVIQCEVSSIILLSLSDRIMFYKTPFPSLVSFFLLMIASILFTMSTIYTLHKVQYSNKWSCHKW